MTGSGKTGLLTVLVEEALLADVPVLMIDVKGDLPNLLLPYPTFPPDALMSWVEGNISPSDPRSPMQVATDLAAQRQHGLARWSIGENELLHYARAIAPRVITPGSSAGEMLHVLSSLERRSARWDHDAESARAALSAAVSLLLRLLGRDPDPAKSKEHVLLSVLAERRLVEGKNVLPPHPQNPPTKRPLVSLMKQARAFGVGVLVATQNPMDLDYRALSNAGLWCVGRLQTDADRNRVVEGLSSAGAQGGYSGAELTSVIKQLEPRWFLMRDAHAQEGTRLLMPRYAMSFLKGPMTRGEIRRALAERAWERG
jgi:hypothetical protein